MDSAYWDGKYARANFEWGYEPSYAGELAAETAAKFNLAKALDIGCGYGRDVLHLANNGVKTTGIDCSRTGINLALHKARSTCRKGVFIAGDVFEYPFSPESYDLVLMSSTRHLLSEGERADLLGIVREILKTGGYVVDMVLSAEDDGFGKGEEAEPGTFEHKGKNTHFFTRDELLRDYAVFSIDTLEECPVKEIHSGGEIHNHITWTVIARKTG